MSGTDSTANTDPAGFARHDRSIRPRPNHANEVVIPHAGQSLPVILKNEQGRIPSCVCVPKPRGSGSNFLARTKIPRIPAATAKSKHRIGQPNGSDAQDRRIKVGPPLTKTCTRRTRLKARAWKGSRTLPETQFPGKRNCCRKPIKRATAYDPSVYTQLATLSTLRALQPTPRPRASLPASAARPRAGTTRSYRGRRRLVRRRPPARRTRQD